MGSQLDSGKAATPLDTKTSPIRVELVKSQDKAKHRTPIILMFVIILVLAAMACFLPFIIGFRLVYVIPQEFPPEEMGANVRELAVAISYPKHLAVGDEGNICATITNVSNTQISGTMVISFTSPPPITISSDSSNTIEFRPLVRGEKRTQIISFSLLQNPWLFPQRGRLDFEASLYTDDGRADTIGNGTIRVAPVPYLNRLIDTTLGIGASIASAIMLLIWARVRKELLGKNSS